MRLFYFKLFNIIRENISSKIILFKWKEKVSKIYFRLYKSYVLYYAFIRVRDYWPILLTYLLTYSMVQSPSWEANWFAASQEIPRISRNPKVHYRTHKRPPPVSILGQPNPVHIPTSHLLQIHPNIIHPPTPRSPQLSLSLRFPHIDPIDPSRDKINEYFAVLKWHHYFKVMILVRWQIFRKLAHSVASCFVPNGGNFIPNHNVFKIFMNESSGLYSRI